MGGSFSSALSEQYYNGQITQNYQGTCGVQCQNTINGVDITLINTNVRGGVQFDQTCNANSQCLMSSTVDSVSDAVFTSANSSTAKKSGVLNIIPSVSSSTSLQSIQQNINNAVQQDCNTTSANNMSNITMFASNSGISGGIAFKQSGTADGQCQLNNAMSASALATGTSNDCSSSGGKKKKKKGTCAGKGSKKSSGKGTLTTIIVIIVVVIVIIFLSRGLGKSPTTPVPAAPLPPVSTIPVQTGVGAAPVSTPTNLVPIATPKPTSLSIPTQFGTPI